MSEKKKIGLYFGSFNPIHVGHQIIGETICTNASLHQVWYVISPQNPFKSSHQLLHEFDRFDMVEAALMDNPKLVASDVEFHLPKPSYTIDTLEFLQKKYPTYEFYLIMGEDNLQGFERWKRYQDILNGYQLLVFPRPYCEKTLFHDHPNVHLVDAPNMNISSTYIRQRVRERKSIKYLVHDAVLEIIEKNGYYL
ncbi:MAG: nicotinate (nicotinamide) nucleotide adenylyltransferase [Bacteroidia bacterium]|nr:nicotinate (nicotinamide) nucleotide adenylyltransferase [Bacteroidia bacterium]MDW8301097.1 nicotinate (nicotinamide) nucleotide adenylyltransferase [Bacteroidia bacterium]